MKEEQGKSKESSHSECVAAYYTREKLLRQANGNDKDKTYIIYLNNAIEDSGVNKAQFIRNCQIGAAIVNNSSNEEIREQMDNMTKTEIYNRFCRVQKGQNQPKKPSKLDLLQEENEKLKADIQKLKASNKPVPKFKGNWKAGDGVPYEMVYTEMEKLLKWLNDNPKHSANWNKLLETAGIKHAVFMVNVENQK